MNRHNPNDESMFIYVDESNQTGELNISKNSKNELNYDIHRYFGLGFGVFTKNEKESLEKELNYKEYSFIKGNELLKKSNNNILQKVLTDSLRYKDNFHYIISDKKFNLARDLFFYFFEDKIKDKNICQEVISLLSTQLVRDIKTKWEIKVIDFFNNNLNLPEFKKFWEDYEFSYEQKKIPNRNYKIEESISRFRKMLSEKKDSNNLENEKSNVHINAIISICHSVMEKYKRTKKIIILHDQINFLSKKETLILQNIKNMFECLEWDIPEIKIEFLDSKTNSIIRFIDRLTSVSTSIIKRNIYFFDNNIPKFSTTQFIFETIKKDNEWNYNLMHSLWNNILTIDKLQLYVSLDNWPIILNIFEMNIDDIPTDFMKNYWKFYIKFYENNFNNLPDMPINLK